MKAITPLLCRAVALLLFVPAAPIFASQLWGITIGNSTSIQLNQIDIATGAVAPTETIGSGLAFASVQDLASDPIREPTVIWAIRNSINGNELISVDPFQKQLLSFVIVGVAGSVRSLAIDPTTGLLYGASGNSLYRITKDTGNATLIGAGSLVIEKGLGFDATGNLYGIGGSNTLVAVDKLTGAMNAISPLNVDRMEDIAVRPENGIMYGLGYPNYDLYQINLASAALTKVGPSFVRPSGVAFTSLPSPIGDFNSDLIVDAADYAAWRKRFGTTYSQSDYDVWRAHFGQTNAPGSGSSFAPAIPEPNSIALLLIALASAAMHNRVRPAIKRNADLAV